MNSFNVQHESQKENCESRAANLESEEHSSQSISPIYKDRLREFTDAELKDRVGGVRLFLRSP